MFRYIKFTIIILLLSGIAMASYAMEMPSAELVIDPLAVLKPPSELNITKKSIYKLNNHTPSITAEYLALTLLEVENEPGMSGPQVTMTFSPTTRANKSTYALVLFSKKPSIEALYKTHGFNKVVKRSLYFFSKKGKRTFRERLSRAGKYIDVLAEIISEKGLPVELSFLPLIESSFNPYAYSPKRAAGLWQFIPATAKKYGLKIDWWVDERRDPVKSTIAAAEYLLDLYERFGSWNLALAAYNAGEGKIGRALRKVRKRDYWTIRKTRYISRETRNYVPSYVAAAAIAIEPESFGFNDITYHESLKYDEVEIDTPMDLSVVAKLTGVKTSKIKELNPELRRWCTPPNVSSYTLKIPRGSKDIFLINLSKARDDELLYVKFYKVKKGDTVGKIARRLGTSTQAIIDVNVLGKRALIIEGKSILVPIDKNHPVKIKAAPTGHLKPILKSRKL